jgi:fructose-bisphosphate aldolase / 6-deoxy-5-ketofructose 1-phosphate synthase
MIIPLTVPKRMQKAYEDHFNCITQNSGRLMLFAGDQRVEHLNEDFFGSGIALDDASPKHLFEIASKGRVGAFAAQLGLISRYGRDYTKIPYIVKINSKSNLVKTTHIDPYSYAWYDVEQIVEFAKNSNLNICGIGYTIYLGSEYESQMLKEAAQLIYKAHEHGLVSILWIYPRGKSVVNQFDPHLIAGACDVGCALGADFIKVNFPQSITGNAFDDFKEAILAAGTSKVICAGGGHKDVREFLSELHDQIHISGASGNATGRNVHQKPLDEAIRFCHAISAITIDKKSVEEAYRIYQGK